MYPSPPPCWETSFLFYTSLLHKLELEVCVPELVLNQTRQDETGPHFPNWRYLDETTFFWSRHSRKFGKNPGYKWDKTGLLNTARESLEQYWILRLFPENLYKQYHLGLFLFGTVHIMCFIIKKNSFNLGSVREFPNVSRPKMRPGIRQSRMPVLCRDREEDVPKCSGREISWKFTVPRKCHSGM